MLGLQVWVELCAEGVNAACRPVHGPHHRQGPPHSAHSHDAMATGSRSGAWLGAALCFALLTVWGRRGCVIAFLLATSSPLPPTPPAALKFLRDG